MPLDKKLVAWLVIHRPSKKSWVHYSPAAPTHLMADYSYAPLFLLPTEQQQ